jgi:hypothetical protein
MGVMKNVYGTAKGLLRFIEELTSGCKLVPALFLRPFYSYFTAIIFIECNAVRVDVIL